MAALAELFALAGGQVSEWSRPLSDRKVEAATDRSWRAPCKGGAFPVGESPTRRNAPAGSTRSNYGGNEMVEAFG